MKNKRTRLFTYIIEKLLPEYRYNLAAFFSETRLHGEEKVIIEHILRTELS